MNCKKILLAVALFYSCAVFPAVPESSDIGEPLEFDINGIKLGDKLTREFFDKYCLPILKKSSEIECKQKTKLNGIKLSILFLFYESKLVAISFNYPSSQYNDLIKAYTKKFSQTPHNSEEPIVLGTGEEYTNKKASWNTASGEFVIEQYWNNFKRGSAHLSSIEYEEYKISKSEEVNEGIIKKLFGDIFDY